MRAFPAFSCENRSVKYRKVFHIVRGSSRTQQLSIDLIYIKAQRGNPAEITYLRSFSSGWKPAVTWDFEAGLLAEFWPCRKRSGGQMVPGLSWDPGLVVV